jgi:hypothetical protein
VPLTQIRNATSNVMYVSPILGEGKSRLVSVSQPFPWAGKRFERRGFGPAPLLNESDRRRLRALEKCQRLKPQWQPLLPRT